MITTIIEKFLKAVDQATFQKLMNHLLHLEGYKFISSPGSVVGRNKTSKGTPDSFFVDGDNYVFCEYTTQERLGKGNTFFKKLQKDIDHCFDITTTKISKNKISKVILGFNEEILPEEHNALKDQVKKHNPNTELITYSIQEIPFRLVYYPGLADKYIAGVTTTKEILFTLSDFLKATENGLQPSLLNPFVGRDEEIKLAKEKLLSSDILIMVGPQGVGKSKLAVHLAEIYEAENYESRIIASSPVPLWDDLNTFIVPSKKYFIVFDDANKALPNLDYLLQFISYREKGSVKAVITVRDYVRADLNRYLLNVPHSELIVDKLKDDQIKDIIRKFVPDEITLDSMIVENILSLSKGNSRLALMATSSILKNNNVAIFKNVFSLYEQYFQKVRSDISFSGKTDNLKVLGILSFFGVLDRNNEELKITLEKNFSINWDELWESIIELESLELVDVLFNEVAKISDQVLATYTFYRTFIDESLATISYSDWIFNFIDKYYKKINRTLIDQINTFGYSVLKDRIITLIIEVQKKFASDEARLLKFYDIFWLYRETDTLLFVRDWIIGLEEEEIDLEKIVYAYNSNDFVWPPEYLRLLINFFDHNIPSTKEAINLAIQLMFKKPSKIPETLKHLKEHLSFHRYDYRSGYPRQHDLINALNKREFSDIERTISNNLFLSIVSGFLKWDCTEHGSKGEGQIVIYNFHLVKTSALMDLRKKILTKLFELFNDHEREVLDAIIKYLQVPIAEFDSNIYAEEQLLLERFLLQNFKIENYSHCKIINKYVKTLQRHNIKPINDWSSYINSDSMQIVRIFTTKYDDKRLTYEESKILEMERIKTYISGKDITFIDETLKKLDEVYKHSLNTNQEYWFDSSIPNIFIILTETDLNLYYKSLELLMLRKFSFQLSYGHFIFNPIKDKLVDPRVMYDLLNRYEYDQKQFWKLLFFQAINEEDIDEFFLQEFIGFLYSMNGRLWFYNTDKYIKFNNQFQSSKHKLPPASESHENIISYLIEILLDKAKSIEIRLDDQLCQNCLKYFVNKLDLLKESYFFQQKQDSHYDHDGKEIAAISSLAPCFLVEYLKESTKDVRFINSRFDELNLTFLWDLDKYETVLDQAMEVIIEKDPLFSSMEHPANVLFKSLKLDENNKARVYDYISKFISKNHSSKQHIEVIMNVITYSFNDKIPSFLKEFLILNKNIEFMKNIWLQKNEVYSGSRVPLIEQRISFLKSLIEMTSDLPSPLDYAPHINIWENEIEWAKKDKQREMKDDFKGWSN